MPKNNENMTEKAKNTCTIYGNALQAARLAASPVTQKRSSATTQTVSAPPGKADDATRVNQSFITLPTCCMPSITITTDSGRFTTHYDIITTSCYGEPDVLLT